VDDHPRVLPQLPRQLVGADVDRIDLRRAAAQQNIGEAAGRRADIERHRSRDIEAEMGQPVVELDPAARHPRMVAALDLERRILGQQVARLCDPLVTREHRAGKDQRLSPRPALREPPRNEQLVGTNPGHSQSAVMLNLFQHPFLRILGVK